MTRIQTGALVLALALALPAILGAQVINQALPIDQTRPLFPGFIWGPANVPAGSDLKVCVNNLSPSAPAQFAALFFGVGDSGKPIGGKAVILDPKQGGCILMKRDTLPQQDPAPFPGQENAIIAVLVRLPVNGAIGPIEIGGAIGPIDLRSGVGAPSDFVGSAQITDPTGAQLGAILPFMSVPMDIKFTRK